MKYKQNHKEQELSVKEEEAEYKTAAGVKTYSIHEAKTNFSKLVKQAVEGETIYIGSFGKPEVKLTVANEKELNAKLRAAAFGCMKGKIKFYKGWDDPLSDDIIEEMYSMRGLEDFEIK